MAIIERDRHLFRAATNHTEEELEMMKRMSRFALVLGIGLCTLPQEGTSTAQDKDKKVAGAYRPAEHFKCRIINDTGTDVRVIVVGFESTTTLPGTLRKG